MILQEPSFIDETRNSFYWRMLPCEWNCYTTCVLTT